MKISTLLFVIAAVCMAVFVVSGTLSILNQTCVVVERTELYYEHTECTYGVLGGLSLFYAFLTCIFAAIGTMIKAVE